jgi:SAM-dependent methyltransferase
MRLILGPGTKHPKQPGEYLLDRVFFNGVDRVHDLDYYPWPVADESCEVITAFHLVEHLRSLLVPFMNECWRILQPGGVLHITTPQAGANVDLEWRDPTHIRCYRPGSFQNYLTPEGIARWGYTDRAWRFPRLETTPKGVLIVEAHPVK